MRRLGLGVVIFGFAVNIYFGVCADVLTNEVQLVDLAGAMRLAGAQNLDIQLARERLAEARARSDGTVWRFFPWIAPGVSYRRHGDLTQEVGGRIIDVEKESYAAGPTLTAQVEVGDAIYRNLAARQLERAAKEGVESRTGEKLLETCQRYFELLEADAAVGIAGEAVRITDNYLGQVREASEAGIAFRGDVLRVQVQSERNRMNLRQAEEQRRIASARLVEVLRLEPTVQLAPARKELVKMFLFPTNQGLPGLLAEAESGRPELREKEALLRAAEAGKRGALYGPLIPSVGAQVFAGGFGGGRNGYDNTFGSSQDYQVGVSWRIGPGGLFDRSQTRLQESLVRSTELERRKVMDAISRQVVEAEARLRSLNDQVNFAKRAAELAEDALRLSQERKEFAVGNVLEAIVAEQELTGARRELARSIAEFNQAQYALAQAVGRLHVQK